MRSIVVTILFELLVCACMLMADPLYAADAVHLSSVREVQVTQFGELPGYPEQDEFCSFTLSAAQARAELTHAQFIDPRQREAEFPWTPCYARGTAVIEGRFAQWTIEASGIAHVSYADGGELWLGNEQWQQLSSSR